MKQPEKKVELNIPHIAPLDFELTEEDMDALSKAPRALKIVYKHVISDEDWNRLGAALGINLKDTADLINHVEAMTHIKVEGVDIRLEPGLIHRLRSRCIRQDFNTFLKDVILKELHSFCGW